MTAPRQTTRCCSNPSRPGRPTPPRRPPRRPPPKRPPKRLPDRQLLMRASQTPIQEPPEPTMWLSPDSIQAFRASHNSLIFNTRLPGFGPIRCLLRAAGSAVDGLTVGPEQIPLGPGLDPRRVRTEGNGDLVARIAHHVERQLDGLRLAEMRPQIGPVNR